MRVGVGFIGVCFLFASICALPACEVELVEGSFRCEDNSDCPKNWKCFFDPEVQENRCYSHVGLVPLGDDTAGDSSKEAPEGTGELPDTDTADVDTGDSTQTDDPGSGVDSETRTHSGRDTATGEEPATDEEPGSGGDTGTEEPATDEEPGSGEDTGTEEPATDEEPGSGEDTGTEEPDTGTGSEVDTRDDTGTGQDTGFQETDTGSETGSAGDTDTFNPDDFDNICSHADECDFKCEKTECSSFCKGRGSCHVQCEKSECDLVCLDDETCSMACEKATCTAESHSSNRLELRCEMPQSICKVGCFGQGECVIICEGGNCEFTHCPDPVSCPDGVLVCNGTC